MHVAPVFVGVGLGGDFELAAKLAKKALTRKVGVHSDREHIARIESELLEMINNTGIGTWRSWRKDHGTGCEHRDICHSHSRNAIGS